MNKPAIAIEGLTKRYGSSERLALNKLSLEVQPGEVYGFLGPNGAGKSTTIRLLLNFIQPTHGGAKILGEDVVQDAVSIKKHLGYVTGDGALYDKLTGREFLSLMSDLQPPTSRSYVHELTKRLQADLGKKLGSLSRGNKQKIALVAALMHQPDVLILDEPTSGLDPLMQEEFYALIREAKQRGGTVFMSSHILGEVQKICDRVGIIKDGHLVGERAIAELATAAQQTFDVVFAGKPPLAALRKLESAHHVSQASDGTVTIHMHGDITPLLGLLAQQKIERLSTRELDLEQEFLRYYTKETAVSA